MIQEKLQEYFTKQYEYQAKDEITYKVTVKNQNEKAKTAYFFL